MRRIGVRVGRRIGSSFAGGSTPAPLTFGFGSGFNTTDVTGTAAGAGPRGSATLGHWVFFGLYFTAVPSGAGYFSADFAGAGWGAWHNGAAVSYFTNGGSNVSPTRTIVAGDLNKVHAMLGFWNPATQLTELYFDGARVGSGTATPTFSVYTTGRIPMGHRFNATSPVHSGVRIGGFSGGSAELTGPEIAQLFADYKANGSIPSVPGKTTNLYDVKASAGGGASFPATIADSIGSQNMTAYAGSAANLTYTAYTTPTVAY